MFFLRCVFWLSLVYASMSWNDHRFAPADLRAQAVAASTEVAPALARRVAAQTSVCGDRVATCARDAVRLAALFAAIQEPSRRPTRRDAASQRDGFRDP